MEIPVWILEAVLSGVISLFILVLNRFLKRLDAMVIKLDALITSVTVHRSELDTMNERNAEQDSRLNSHAKRIRELEVKQK